MVRDIRFGSLSNALLVGYSWRRNNHTGCNMRIAAGHLQEGFIAQRTVPRINTHRTRLGIPRGFDWTEEDRFAELVLFRSDFHAGCSYPTFLGIFDFAIVDWNGVSICFIDIYQLI